MPVGQRYAGSIRMQPVPDSDPDEGPRKSESTSGRQREHSPLHRWMLRVVFQTFCLAWLVPMLFLLIKNFQTWIIGASAFCPDRHCWADLFDPDLSKVWSTEKRLDKESHDLAGALQFAAKALEVWFTVIAASFVYLYTMMLARKKEG